MDRRWTLVLIVVVIVLYLAGMNDQWAALRDSALYLGLGQSLAAGHGMEFNGQQWWGIPPGFPAVVAVSDMVFGPRYWPLNLFERLCGLGMILFACLCLRQLAQGLPDSLRPGIVVAGAPAIAFSEQLYATSGHIMTDVPFGLLVMVALYACLRGSRGHWTWYLLGAGAMAAACLVRIVGPVIAIGFVLAVVAEAVSRRSWRPLLAMFGIGVIGGGLFLAWFFLLRSHHDTATLDYFEIPLKRFDFLNPHRWKEFGLGLARAPAAMCSCIVDQKLDYMYFNVIPAAVALVGLGVAAWRRQFLVVFPLILYIAALAWVAPGAVAERYFLPLMPLLVYGLVLGARAVAVGFLRLRAQRPKRCPAPRWPPRRWASPAACASPSARRRWPARSTSCITIPTTRPMSTVRGPPTSTPAGTCAGAHSPSDQVLAPRNTVIHYLSGLPVAGDRGPTGLNMRRLAENKPEDFVQAALSGDFRYVIVPVRDTVEDSSASDEPALPEKTAPKKKAASASDEPRLTKEEEQRKWAEAVCGLLDASPQFVHPPREFHGLLLYERAP